MFKKSALYLLVSTVLFNVLIIACLIHSLGRKRDKSGANNNTGLSTESLPYPAERRKINK